MFEYIIKRILYFILTFFIISFFAFGLSKLAPGDPVKLALGKTDQGGAGQLQEKMAGDQAYRNKAEEMGMNLPVFYFSFNSAAVPDTLYRILKTDQRETLSRLIDQYGNWPKIQEYYHNIQALEVAMFKVDKVEGNFDDYSNIRSGINILYASHKDNTISYTLDDMVKSAKNPLMAPILADIDKLVASYQAVKDNPTRSLNYIPSFKWYSNHNQYHTWMFGNAPWFASADKQLGKRRGFIRGDFGISYQDKREVQSVLKDAIRWTVLLNIIAVSIAYLISIPLGVQTAVKKGSRFDRVSTVTLFALYSLPTFWIATILVVFLTTKEYGAWLDWFPTFGLTSSEIPDTASAWTKFWDLAHHLVLPVFCMTYGSFAYLSRQMRGGALNVLRMDYIRTAYAKGLDSKTVIWKHVFRNSLIPLITLFAYLFPAAISGSVVIEVIFAIPGMGMKAYGAIVARDYPIVFTVVMFSAILTMIGNLVADVLYSVVDPRISFTKKA